jgi:hypothetical protein
MKIGAPTVYAPRDQSPGGSQMKAILAGGITGGVEICITYPTGKMNCSRSSSVTKLRVRKNYNAVVRKGVSQRPVAGGKGYSPHKWYHWII